MASYRYERDIKPEDLIQETPPPLTLGAAAACQLVALPLVLCGADRCCPAGGGVFRLEPSHRGAAGLHRGSGEPHRPGHCFPQPAGDPAGSPFAGDVNGDGKVKVTVKGIWLALDFETQDAALQRLMQSSEDKLNSDFYLCESTCSSWTTPAAMEQRYGCFQTLDGTDPEEGRRSVGGRLCSAAARHRPLPMMCRAKALPSGTRLAA